MKKYEDRRKDVKTKKGKNVFFFKKMQIEKRSKKRRLNSSFFNKNDLFVQCRIERSSVITGGLKTVCTDNQIH